MDILQALEAIEHNHISCLRSMDKKVTMKILWDNKLNEFLILFIDTGVYKILTGRMVLVLSDIKWEVET